MTLKELGIDESLLSEEKRIEYSEIQKKVGSLEKVLETTQDTVAKTAISELISSEKRKAEEIVAFAKQWQKRIEVNKQLVELAQTIAVPKEFPKLKITLSYEKGKGWKIQKTAKKKTGNGGGRSQVRFVVDGVAMNRQEVEDKFHIGVVTKGTNAIISSLVKMGKRVAIA